MLYARRRFCLAFDVCIEQHVDKLISTVESNDVAKFHDFPIGKLLAQLVPDVRMDTVRIVQRSVREPDSQDCAFIRKPLRRSAKRLSVAAARVLRAVGTDFFLEISRQHQAVGNDCRKLCKRLLQLGIMPQQPAHRATITRRVRYSCHYKPLSMITSFTCRRESGHVPDRPTASRRRVPARY